jgi:hypothetical protein
MKYLLIRNAGELDRRAITLIGASSKRGSDTAIGMFGSGFSYTVGTLLRQNLNFRIFSGETEIKIHTEAENFRGQTVNVIFVDGVQTSLTAEIGPKWTETECIREIWSNAIDEGDASRVVLTEVMGGVPSVTSIYVEINEAVQMMLDSWDRFFITKSEEPIHENSAGRIFAPSVVRPANFYRRGVWCAEKNDSKSKFVYDLNEVNLPESRVIDSNAAFWQCKEVLSECDSDRVFTTLLDLALHTFVPEFYRMFNGSVGAATIKKLLLEWKYQYIADVLYRPQVTEDLAKVTFFCDSASTATDLIHLTGMPHVSSAIVPKKPYTKRLPNTAETWGVVSALNLLKKAGIDMSEFPVVFGTMDDVNCLAIADMLENKIILSENACQNQSTLFKCLLEEYIHLKYRVRDNTVEQQHAYLELLYGVIIRAAK